MSLETKTKTIDGTRYAYRPMGAKKGRRLFTELVQRFGGAFGDSVTGAGADQLAAGGKAIGALCAKLDPDFHERLVAELFAHTDIEVADGAVKRLADVAEQVFAGRIMHELLVTEFALESQFSDFLEFVKRALNTSGKRAELPTATPGASGSNSPTG